MAITYNSVAIGSQNWMTENLKTTKYNDGTDIAFITDSLGWLNDHWVPIHGSSQ
jgi:hypothetical protein